MILDASALADVLLQSPRRAARIEAEIRAATGLHTLDFAWIEVASVIRRKQAGGDLDATEGQQVLDDLNDMPIERHPVAGLVDRIWQLRATHTAYDAAYIALAEAMSIPLLTTDGPLARSHGHRAVVKLIS